MELMAEQDTSLICRAAAITITAISAIWLIDCLILWPKRRLHLALMSKININIDPGAVCPAADVAALPNMFLWHFWPIGRQSSPSARWPIECSRRERGLLAVTLPVDEFPADYAIMFGHTRTPAPGVCVCVSLVSVYLTQIACY